MTDIDLRGFRSKPPDKQIANFKINRAIQETNAIRINKILKVDDVVFISIFGIPQVRYKDFTVKRISRKIEWHGGFDIKEGDEVCITIMSKEAFERLQRLQHMDDAIAKIREAFDV